MRETKQLCSTLAMVLFIAGLTWMGCALGSSRIKSEFGKKMEAALSRLPVVTNRVPGAPPLRTNITLEWDCPNSEYQTFEFVYRTNLNSPWLFYTNVIGRRRLTVPNEHGAYFFTISRTWLTESTNHVLYLRGFEP